MTGKKRAVEIFEVMGRKGDKVSLDLEGYLVGYNAYRGSDFAGAVKASIGLAEEGGPCQPPDFVA